MITKQNDLFLAKEILHQLGGNKFIAMTGAKNISGGNYSLQFKIMRNSRRVTHVKIEINGLDLYDLTFYSIRGYDSPIIRSQANNIYADMLQTTFTEHTGLNTHF